MNLKRRALLREVMSTAWSFFRAAAARNEPYERFGESSAVGVALRQKPARLRRAGPLGPTGVSEFVPDP